LRPACERNSRRRAGRETFFGFQKKRLIDQPEPGFPWSTGQTSGRFIFVYDKLEAQWQL
jgi:hypothetical protein